MDLRLLMLEQLADKANAARDSHVLAEGFGVLAIGRVHDLCELGEGIDLSLRRALRFERLDEGWQHWSAQIRAEKM